MNIIEATREAMDKGVGIRNTSCKHNYLLPTNTKECYLVIPIGYTLGSNYEKIPAPRWNPKAEDILKEDWELYPLNDITPTCIKRYCCK